LGNGELASLAYGSFKELLKFKEYIIFEKRRWFPGNLVVDFGQNLVVDFGQNLVVDFGQNLVPFLTSILVPFFTDCRFALNAVPALLKCDFGPLFEDSSISDSKCCFIQCPPY
jgi:hypothetical protein